MSAEDAEQDLPFDERLLAKRQALLEGNAPIYPYAYDSVRAIAGGSEWPRSIASVPLLVKKVVDNSPGASLPGCGGPPTKRIG